MLYCNSTGKINYFLNIFFIFLINVFYRKKNFCVKLLLLTFFNICMRFLFILRSPVSKNHNIHGCFSLMCMCIFYQHFRKVNYSTKGKFVFPHFYEMMMLLKTYYVNRRNCLYSGVHKLVRMLYGEFSSFFVCVALVLYQHA